MLRLRESRQFPRVGPLNLRTSSSDSNITRPRSTNNSPNFGDRQSPRVAQSNPNLTQKKLSTRIADLESHLGQAQVELKNLKDQLVNAKKEARVLLEKKTKKPKTKDFFQVEDDEKEEKRVSKVPNESHRETEKVDLEDPKDDISEIIDLDIDETKPTEVKKPSFDDLALKDEEISLLKAKLDEKDKDLEASRLENKSLKANIDEFSLEKFTNEAKQEEMKLELAQLGSALESKKASETELKKKLDELEVEKVGLEAEMKKMRIQTEQWRKAADVAASVLAGEAGMNGRRVWERCESMDKHINNMFHVYDSDEGFRGGKRKGLGMRMLGDLWKKKGQK